MKLNAIAVAVAAALLSFGAVAQEKKPESQAGQSSSPTMSQEQKPEQKAEKKAEGSAAAGGTAAGGETKAKAGGKAQNPEMIKQAQTKLNEQGHNVGEVDGKMGPKTEKALKDFQQAKGLKATGQLDTQTMSALGVSGSAGAGASAAGDKPASAEKKSEGSAAAGATPSTEEKKPEGAAATGEQKPQTPAGGETKPGEKKY